MGYQGEDKEKARNYLLAYPRSTLQEASDALNVSRRTVSYARAELINEGRIKKRKSKWKPHNFLYKKMGVLDPPPVHVVKKVILHQMPLFSNEIQEERELVTEIPPEQVLSTEELVSEITTQTGKEVRDLSVEEMRQILSKIARSSSIQPQVRIAAITQKHKIDSGEEDRHELGPGKPKTRREALERLSMLMKACGLQLVTDAMEQTFEIFKAQNEEKAVEQGQTIETTAETIDAQGSPSPVPAT